MVPAFEARRTTPAPVVRRDPNGVFRYRSRVETGVEAGTRTNLPAVSRSRVVMNAFVSYIIQSDVSVIPESEPMQ